MESEVGTPPTDIGPPGGTLSPPGGQTDARGLELLAYATRVDDARLLVIIKDGKVMRWRHLPHKRMARR
jgi:hypothetical protein